MALATLSIDLVAKLASFEQDMGKAHREAQLPKNYLGDGKFTGAAARPAAQAARPANAHVPENTDGDGMPF